jgi:hypothetical protein
MSNLTVSCIQYNSLDYSSASSVGLCHLRLVLRANRLLRRSGTKESALFTEIIRHVRTLVRTVQYSTTIDNSEFDIGLIQRVVPFWCLG